MIEKYNFISPLLEQLHREIDKNNYKAIIWLGMHPWIRIIYEDLLDYGISDFSVLDNNSEIYNLEVCPFTEDLRYANRIITVKPMSEIKELDADTGIFMANTHFVELCWQLAQYGVEKERIINLYDYTRGYDSFWKNQKKIVDKYTPISGREIQLRQLDMLKYFKRICEENNLNYFLGYGTLLGAVRHEGFIPWDDDIDIFMPYDDYLEMIRVMSKNVNEKYRLIDWRVEPKFSRPNARIVDAETYMIHPNIFGYAIFGCCISIFPMAGYPDRKTEWMERLERNKKQYLSWLYYTTVCDVRADEDTDYRSEISEDVFTLPYYEAEKVGVTFWLVTKSWVADRELFDKKEKMKFEDEYFDVPGGWDKLLMMFYGDYMQIPDVSKREQHLFPTYVKR